MPVTRNFAGFAVCFILPMLCLTAAPVHADDEADTLRRAIALFEDGKYLAAQELLLSVDRAKLAAKARARRDDYLNRIQVAVTMEDKALRDLEDAETAISDGQAQRARHLLGAVLSNDYAAQPLRTAARAKLNELDRASSDRGAVTTKLGERNECGEHRCRVSVVAVEQYVPPGNLGYLAPHGGGSRGR